MIIEVSAIRCSQQIRFVFQRVGDLLSKASGLWTASHYSIPLLIVVFSNRSYYNDEEHQERMAQVRGRPWSQSQIRMSCRSCWAKLKVVKAGKPALVDVVCEMRP